MATNGKYRVGWIVYPSLRKLRMLLRTKDFSKKGLGRCGLTSTRSCAKLATSKSGNGDSNGTSTTIQLETGQCAENVFCMPLHLAGSGWLQPGTIFSHRGAYFATDAASVRPNCYEYTSADGYVSPDPHARSLSHLHARSPYCHVYPNPSHCCACRVACPPVPRFCARASCRPGLCHAGRVLGGERRVGDRRV
jgi:hypothetical protein